MSYCAWCEKWGRKPVVKLSEPRHVVIGDGVKIHLIAVTPVKAGKTICAVHQTISTPEASARFKGEYRSD